MKKVIVVVTSCYKQKVIVVVYCPMYSSSKKVLSKTKTFPLELDISVSRTGNF